MASKQKLKKQRDEWKERCENQLEWIDHLEESAEDAELHQVRLVREADSWKVVADGALQKVRGLQHQRDEVLGAIRAATAENVELDVSVLGLCQVIPTERWKRVVRALASQHWT